MVNIKDLGYELQIWNSQTQKRKHKQAFSDYCVINITPLKIIHYRPLRQNFKSSYKLISVSSNKQIYLKTHKKEVWCKAKLNYSITKNFTALGATFT